VSLASLPPGMGLMNATNEIVDRAIAYTDRILDTMPSYREAAVAGLRRLGLNLAEKSPEHPAIRRLDAYLDAVGEGSSKGAP
jgi:hypothetical protein